MLYGVVAICDKKNLNIIIQNNYTTAF